MVLGCVVAYALGASAGRVLALPVVGEGELARAQRLFYNIGPAALILTRGVPVLAEAGAMAAGAARMPFWTFMAATSLANAVILDPSANLTVAGIAERNGIAFGFLTFLKLAFPMMVVSIVIAMGYLLLRYLM